MQMLRGKRILTAILSMVGAAICCAGLAPSTLAQSSSSAVNGVVTDATKAVVVGTKVVLRNADTNVERVTVSNSTGDYFFSSVPLPGTPLRSRRRTSARRRSPRLTLVSRRRSL